MQKHRDMQELSQQVMSALQVPSDLTRRSTTFITCKITDPEFTFQCNHCGACCRANLAITVTIQDIACWIDQEQYHVLPMIIFYPHEGLHDEKVQDRLFFMINKEEYSKRKENFSPALIECLESINPSLRDSTNDDDGKDCVWFNPSTRGCTIHGNQPFICKAFPYQHACEVLMHGRRKLHNPNIFYDECPTACFASGKTIKQAGASNAIKQLHASKHGIMVYFKMAFNDESTGRTWESILEPFRKAHELFLEMGARFHVNRFL